MTRDGARIETRGPWQERGQLVVFTTASGTLSSMRLTEIDLERSHSATAAAARVATAPSPPSAPPPPSAPTQVRIVIDGDDIPRAAPRTAGQEPEAATDAAEVATTPFLDRLRVTRWEAVPRPERGGVEVVGQLSNGNRSVASDLRLDVLLYGLDGHQVAAGRAFLDRPSVAGGSRVRFRIPFEDVAIVDRVEFRVDATEILLGASTYDPASGEDP